MPNQKAPSRPWILNSGVRSRDRTFAQKKSAIGVAVLRAYNSSIGARFAIHHRLTNETILVQHLAGHRVVVTFHSSGKGE